MLLRTCVPKMKAWEVMNMMGKSEIKAWETKLLTCMIKPV